MIYEFEPILDPIGIEKTHTHCTQASLNTGELGSFLLDIKNSWSITSM